MELKDYFRVVWRYWWLIAGLVVVVGVGSWIFQRATRAGVSSERALYDWRHAPPATEVSGYDPILRRIRHPNTSRRFWEIIKSDTFATM